MKRFLRPLRFLLLVLRNYKWTIFPVVIAAFISWFISWYMGKVPRYISNNESYIEDTNIMTNLNESKFYCYLDYSPSMLGFFGTPGSNMDKFSNALENMVNGNTFSGEESVYICNNKIQPGLDIKGLLEYMRTVNKNYEDNVKTKELSRIFTESYDGNNNQYESSEDAVNMIITDMNFISGEKGVAVHKEWIKDFAEQLAIQSEKSNICIYNIRSDFLGELNTDEYDPTWYSENSNIDNSHSFFVIILSKDKFYSSFINELESNLENQNINYSENKFELKDNMFDEHKIVFDKTVLREKNKLEQMIQFLNLDNLSMGKIPDNAVGFGIRYPKDGEEDKVSAITNLPIQKIELPGMYFNSNVESNDSKININADIYYNSYLLHYQEYTDNSFITNINADIQPDDSGEGYSLCLSLNINKYAELPKKIVGSRCMVIDLHLQMEQPEYTLPEWVLSINTNKLENDWSRKIAIKQLFEKIIAAKEENYKSNTTEYQRWMGNFLIYLSY